jgi:LuxR family maltose regulon positive regulatory protein
MTPATPILITKLFVPPSNPRHVQRPRLHAMLNEGLKARLMLVSAPAGFGKTTLLANWVDGLKLKVEGRFDPPGNMQLANYQPATSVAWISLDEGDNDIARFLAYVAAALEMVKPGIASKLSGVVEAPQFSQVEGSLNSLINDLASANHSIVLVLDDYHTIASQAIHQALNHLIEHMPPPLHLVLATRADPPLHLARLRARGQLIEIRQDDLRFTPEEASLFLRQSRGLELTEDQFAALASRTEGWIAGLHLASLAIQPAFSSQNQGNVSDFIRNFAGSSRFILDYLMEEVLSRQPEAIQDFLLQTSILERLNAPLCDAIIEMSERPNVSTLKRSNEILEYLDRANLFIVPLDPQRRWYRYHHLFAELLRQRLEAARPGDKSGLHQRASRWF